LSVKNQKWKSTEVVAAEVGDEDSLNVVGIGSEFSHGDQRGCTTINEKRPMGVFDIEAGVEASSAAKRISRTQKSKFHRTPLAISR
jgi:hypothetical protein